MKITTAISLIGTLAGLACLWTGAASAHEQAQARHPAGTAFDTTTLVSASLHGPWEIASGATAIHFNRPLLEGLGVSLLDLQRSAVTAHAGYVGFEIVTPASIAFSTAGGGLETVEAIALRHQGGFLLGLDGERLDLRNFSLRRAPHGLDLIDANDNPVFTLSAAHIYRDAIGGQLYVMQMDLKVSQWLAGRLGQPEFAGQLVGLVDLIADIRPASDASREMPARGDCVADFGDGTIDLMLTELNGISSLALDAGEVAFAPSAELRNIGTNDVRWFWAIDPPGFNGPNVGAHPFLAMHYYRIVDGAIEQIARSDLKHAWNTVNNNCPCASGQVMFVGCEDTYGVGNNGNQFYFGPREELDAHTASWQSLGSHFDAEPVDDFRDHENGFGEHDALEHRLSVAESALQVAGAEYLIEAWYIAAGDIDILNGMAWRRVTQEKIGATWSFSFDDTETTNGPAIDAWVAPGTADPDARSTLRDSGDGLLKLAVRVTDLGAGMFHYEYALMNLDFDRQVDAFTVPLPPGATVSNAGFGDGDADFANDWSIAQDGNLLTWTAPAGHALDWGVMKNMRFDVDAAPAEAAVALRALEGGGPDSLATLSLVPAADMAVDTDADGIADAVDNCTLVANPDQRDTDGDFFGNVCDADLNGDGQVNFPDLSLLKDAFFSSGDVDEDLDGDGEVNFPDLNLMKEGFFAPPGPSGLNPAR